MTRLSKALALALLVACCGAGSASAQRTPGDYALFWNYWKDDCTTPTTTGGLAYGCPAIPQPQPTPTGSGDPRGSGGSGGSGGGAGGGGGGA